MKCGWMVSGDGDCVDKPRPAVIVQSDSFNSTSSVAICIFTTNGAKRR